MAILTNVGIMTFTMESFSTDLNEQYKAFLYFTICFFLVKAFLEWLIPDLPMAIATILKRHDHVIEKHLKGFVTVKGRDVPPEKTKFRVDFAEIIGAQKRIPSGVVDPADVKVAFSDERKEEE